MDYKSSENAIVWKIKHDLQESYFFAVYYKKGKDDIGLDALSRSSNNNLESDFEKVKI